MLHFALGIQPAVWATGIRDLPALGIIDAVIEAERDRRLRCPSPLVRAADAYLVSRGAGKTIIAGDPWFSDWARDTFIALRGLCLSTGRLTDARDAEPLPRRRPAPGIQLDRRVVVVVTGELLRDGREPIAQCSRDSTGIVSRPPAGR